MIIQNILFPSSQTCTEETLYFRKTKTNSETCLKQGCLHLSKGSTITFDTYFNGLSIGKWQKYTAVSQVKLHLKISGIMRICLQHKMLQGEQVKTQILSETVCESAEEIQDFWLPFPSEAADGMYCFSMEALTEDAVLHKADYAAEDAEVSPQNVKIAVVICTYRREQFVLKNLELLHLHFLHNPQSELRENLELFIVDNAGTLDVETLADEHVHVFQNKNVGGAGGFTRGMLEIQKVREQLGITHILLTDDDIVYEPEAIFRTWTMLRCISPEYKNAFIGGAMLRLDRQYIQTESGAVWNGGDLISLKKGLDLRQTDHCLMNEVEETVDYNAWWYCLFPVSVAAEDNLPIPFFIRCDDVEYGLRNAAGQIILMNGICVWHEPFENKYASSMFYYMFRNRLITNAIYGIAQPLQEVKKQLCGYAMYEIRLYRYRNAKILMQSMEDFLGGTAWLAAQDAQERHKRLLADGYQLQPLETLACGASFDSELYEQEKHAVQPMNLFHRVIANRTINGTLLPPKRKFTIVPAEGAQQISIFRTEEIMNYDEASGKAFMTQRNLHEMYECRKQLRALCRKMDQCYEQAVRDFSENSKKLQTKEFWMGYLGLQE